MSQVSLGKFVSERPCWLLAAGHYNSQVEFKVSNAKTETKKKKNKYKDNHKCKVLNKKTISHASWVAYNSQVQRQRQMHRQHHISLFGKNVVPSIIQKLFLNKKQVLLGP